MLTACSYSFGGDGGGGGGADATTGSVFVTVGPSASQTATAQSVTASTSPAVSTVSTDVIASTAEMSASTGSLPMPLEPCSAADDFQDGNATSQRWDEFAQYAWWEDGHIRTQIPGGALRAYFGLVASNTSQGNCFISIQPSGYDFATPRAAFVDEADASDFVNAVYYPYPDEFSIGYEGSDKVISQVAQPIALGLARYEGKLFAGYKNESGWKLYRLPGLPAWATPGATHAMRQVFGVGSEAYRSANFDNYAYDVITTTDLEAAGDWSALP